MDWMEQKTVVVSYTLLWWGGIANHAVHFVTKRQIWYISRRNPDIGPLQIGILMIMAGIF